MSIINLIIFFGILMFALLTSSYLAGLILVLVLSVWEIVEYGMAHSMFLLMCELTAALFVMKETKLRKGDSPLLKYNPVYKKNVLPRKVQFTICCVLLLAFLIRIVPLRQTVRVDDCARQEGEYRRDANAFINKIVIAYKKGEDYNSIANSNPYTNDVFVCNVVALLLSEYGHCDALNDTVSIALQSNRSDRQEVLLRLSEKCVEESSNVVRRIVAAKIGESNTARMAKDFCRFYIELQRKCCRSLDRNCVDEQTN